MGYVVGGFPGTKPLMDLCDSWNVPFNFNLQNMGWIVLTFNSEEERQRVLEGGPYMINGRNFVLKHMPPMFQFDKDVLRTLPVWINLPGLPCEMWNAKILGNFCSVVGNPICNNALTSNKKRISYARVLVQVNLAEELVKEVIIDMPNGAVKHQAATCENLPRFCDHCKVLGHTKERCKG